MTRAPASAEPVLYIWGCNSSCALQLGTAGTWTLSPHWVTAANPLAPAGITPRPCSTPRSSSLAGWPWRGGSSRLWGQKPHLTEGQPLSLQSLCQLGHDSGLVHCPCHQPRLAQGSLPRRSPCQLSGLTGGPGSLPSRCCWCHSVCMCPPSGIGAAPILPACTGTGSAGMAEKLQSRAL